MEETNLARTDQLNLDYKLEPRILATIIKFHRKKSGLSQLELAKLAGVGKTVVFDLEHAKATVQLNILFKIMETLNISIILQSPLMAIYKIEESENHS